MFDIEGMRVLITASSRGIGYGIAKVLVREGCKVVINGRNEERLRKAVEELEKIGSGQVYGVRADLTNPEELEVLVKKAIEYLNGLDALVYIPSPPKPGYFKDLSFDDWEHGIKQLVTSPVRLTYLVLPYLLESRNPSIIYVTSIAVKEPIPNIVLSNTLRISIQGLAKSLSKELGPKGVRVNTILPGYIMTDRLKQVVQDKARRENKSEEGVLREFKEKVPLKRIGKPEDIGYLVAFLISRYASYINGASIPVDGGLLNSVF
ncbi:MAG: short-chain dehydrogenase [Thermoprotei archaeon]|nr:MAG: short-chain dehydrogenase [Thermoprotei archaeon]